MATYPKCGTTWTHQICLLLLNNGDASAWSADPHGFAKHEAGLASWPEMQYLPRLIRVLASCTNTKNSTRSGITHIYIYMVIYERLCMNGLDWAVSLAVATDDDDDGELVADTCVKVRLT